MLRNIYLHGKLGEEFGSVWNLDVESVSEAAHAINVNTDGKFGIAARDMLVEVVRGDELEYGEKIDKSLINFNYKSGDFHIVPAVHGSGQAFAAYLLVAIVLAGAMYVFTSQTPMPEDNFESDKAGYKFSGLRTTDTQGSPIPLIYGEVYTGSIVISQGIKIEEVVD